MAEAAELANYLPLSFKTPKEQEYIEFLWDAFETNYKHGKYQFAFLAYHMLTMNYTVSRERTGPASPCIICISTWQWTRKSARSCAPTIHGMLAA